MEWREIEVFLTLTEELHFGRTAERLHLSQARVSQTVQALERRVGGRLFDRTSRQVHLTPLGERFRDQLRPGYEGILQAYESARDSARGIVGDLRISVISSLAGGPSFDRIVRRFEATYPLCPVEISEASTNEALDQARDGRIDLVTAYLPLDQGDLTLGPVLYARERALIVAVDHPLADRELVTVEDLADVPVSKLADIPEETIDAWVPPRTPSGRPIQRVPITKVQASATLGSMIARGQVCHPTVAGYLEFFSYPGLVEIPLSGLPMLESALAWVTSRESAAIRAFAKCAEEVLTADSG